MRSTRTASDTAASGGRSRKESSCEGGATVSRPGRSCAPTLSSGHDDSPRPRAGAGPLARGVARRAARQLALLLAWAAGHALLRLFLSSTLTADDAREAVLAQTLQWGYQARQPPLYNWLVWAPSDSSAPASSR